MEQNTMLIKALTSFDRSFEPQFDLYDNMTYTRDVGFCTYTPRVIATGNVIKYYQYQIGKPQIIQLSDEEFEIPAYRLRSEEDRISDAGKEDETALGNESGDASYAEQLITDDSGSGVFDPDALKDELGAAEEPYDDDEIYVIPPLSELD